MQLLRKDTMSVAAGALLIVAQAVVLGLVVNTLNPNRLPITRRTLAEIPKLERKQVLPNSMFGSDELGRIQPYSTTSDHAKTLFDQHGAVFLDARCEADYARGHIAGALRLHVHDPELMLGSTLAGIPRDRTVIVYCSDPQCEASIRIAEMLAGMGLNRVLILRGGLSGWRNAGYPVVGGKP